MATVVEKLQDLEYDELLTLGVIEQNDDLTAIFNMDINMPFNLLYKLQKEGQLNQVTKDLLLQIFNGIILTKQNLINQYLTLGNQEVPKVVKEVEKPLKIEEYAMPLDDDTLYMSAPKPMSPMGVGKTIKLDLTNETELSSLPEPAIGVDHGFVETLVEKAKEQGIKVKVVKEKDIPRRYGKQQIEKDIKEQGFKATPLQRVGLKLNDLKNMNANLMTRFIKDYHLDDKIMTEADCMEILATITMVERKLEKITKKK